MSLALYQIDPSYCHYLRLFDALVSIAEEGKQRRPFLGIVLQIHAFSFYAPLTSPKEKHRHMRNTLDFMKIQKGELGAINLNNMIPVHPSLVSRVRFHKGNIDSSMPTYELLMLQQLDWCMRHQDEIYEKAKRLYEMSIAGSLPKSVEKRCCDFYGDSLQMLAYLAECQEQVVEDIWMPVSYAATIQVPPSIYSPSSILLSL